MVMSVYKEKCHFQSERGCKALTEMLCKILTEKLCRKGKCSFYKTTEDVKKDLIKYPPCDYSAIFAERHKNDK